MSGASQRTLAGTSYAPLQKPGTILTGRDEQELISGTGFALERGLQFRDWWQWCESTGSFPEVFRLMRSHNPAEASYGFRGEVQGLPVMGIVQQMPYATPKGGSPEHNRDQMREFVLHYFTRLSDFSRPASFVPEGLGPIPLPLRPFSWRDEPQAQALGFGFEQLYYRVAGGGPVRAFRDEERFRIVDLRRVGAEFDWILLRVRIYDFTLHFRPFGREYPSLEVPLRESNYLLVTPHFIRDDPDPRDGTLGRFSFGYALLTNPGPPGLLAYGPGWFRAGFQNFEFIVESDGSSRVRMAFMVDRPERIVSLPLNPLELGFLLTDALTAGAASRRLPNLRRLLAEAGGGLRAGIDPVLAYIDLADLISGGYSRRELGITKCELERDFLEQHFDQHYEMITGSLSTWSQVRDWTDPATIPEWVKEGILHI
jgi:hypothetical protein